MHFSLFQYLSASIFSSKTAAPVTGISLLHANADIRLPVCDTIQCPDMLPVCRCTEMVLLPSFVRIIDHQIIVINRKRKLRSCYAARQMLCVTLIGSCLIVSKDLLDLQIFHIFCEPHCIFYHNTAFSVRTPNLCIFNPRQIPP